MIRKLLCWLGWHEKGMTYYVCYGRVLRKEYCIHCKKIIKEEVLNRSNIKVLYNGESTKLQKDYEDIVDTTESLKDNT